MKKRHWRKIVRQQDTKACTCGPHKEEERWAERNKMIWEEDYDEITI